MIIYKKIFDDEFCDYAVNYIKKNCRVSHTKEVFGWWMWNIWGESNLPKYEDEFYDNSFKDIIFESKLKKYFLKYENNKFFKSNFMNKKSNSWKYKIYKRIFSFSTLKKTIESNEFKVVKFYGGPFLYASEKKNSIIKKILNNILQYLLDKKLFIFLIRVADNIVFLSKPNQKQ